MTIFDISPVVSEDLAVWPGDTAYKRTVLMDTDQGDHLGLSKIETTLHLGAHTDAPNHYGAKSSGIASRALEYYLGPAQVVDVDLPPGESIKPEHLKGLKLEAPRLLFRTNSFPNPNQWNEDFCSLSAELIDYLAAAQALLVGIDTPSVDPFTSKELPAHKAILRHNLAILEGIVLTDIDPGVYQLSALPLPLQGADASPVRAVLFR